MPIRRLRTSIYPHNRISNLDQLLPTILSIERGITRTGALVGSNDLNCMIFWIISAALWQFASRVRKWRVSGGISFCVAALLTWLRFMAGREFCRRNSEKVRSLNRVVGRTPDAAPMGSWIGDWSPATNAVGWSLGAIEVRTGSCNDPNSAWAYASLIQTECSACPKKRANAEVLEKILPKTIAVA